MRPAAAPAAHALRDLANLRLEPNAQVGLVADDALAEWSLELARRCPAGLVFATSPDLDRLAPLLVSLEEGAVTNVLPLLGTPSRACFPEGRLDQIVLASTLPAISDREAYLASLGAALGLEGQLAVSSHLGLEEELERAGFSQTGGAGEEMQLWRPRNQW